MSSGVEQRYRYTVDAHIDRGWSKVLSYDPVVIYTAFDHGQPLGMAGSVGDEFHAHPITFLMAFRWNIESRDMAAWMAGRVAEYRARNPLHRFIYLCNCEVEYEFARAAGLDADLLNHNLTCDENLLFPIEGPRLFHAIYNARLSDWKRHELTAEIESCAFICYRPDHMDPAVAHQQEQQLIHRHKQWPGHVFLNRWTDEGPIKMEYSEVNSALSTAKVGLCLSSSEGAMQASIEYLLAGLPIVNTPSRGGREWYFDDEYCVTCDPTPSAVAQAVQDVIARCVPASYIREKTIKKVHADRERFKALVNTLVAEGHGTPTLGQGWPFERKIMTKALWSEASNELRHALADLANSPRPAIFA